eukprot:4436757-Prymnesium_polylepis.1
MVVTWPKTALLTSRPFAVTSVGILTHASPSRDPLEDAPPLNGTLDRLQARSTLETRRGAPHGLPPSAAAEAAVPNTARASLRLQRTVGRSRHQPSGELFRRHGWTNGP